MDRSEGERIETAEAERDERRRAPASIIEERADVGDEIFATIATIGRPIGVAVAPLVDRQHVVVPGQIRRHLVPTVRRLRASMNQEQR